MRLCLLAAGFATRMYPLTSDCAKPLLEVGGELLASRLLRQALDSGELEAVTVVCNARFVEDFTRWASEQPVPVQVVSNDAEQDSQARGAVADLQLLLSSVHGDGENGYLVVAGDNWLEQGFSSCRRAFEQNPERPLVVVRQVPEPVPGGRYSEVLFNTDGTVTRFREKPMVAESVWSAIAVYFFPKELPQWVAKYLDQDGNPDAPGHFLAWVCEHHRLRSTPLQGAWHDVGSLEGLASLRDALDARG